MREGYRGSTEPIPAMKTVRPTSINDKGEIVTDGGHIVGKVIYRDARPASGTGSMRGLALCSRCGKGTVPPGQVCEACSATDPVCIYCGGVGHKPEDCATPCDGLRDEIYTLKLQRKWQKEAIQRVRAVLAEWRAKDDLADEIGEGGWAPPLGPLADEVEAALIHDDSEKADG